MSQKPSYQELKRKVESLEKENANYRHLLANVNEIVYRVDLYAKIKYISPNSERITGYPPQELVGRFFTDFVHPDDFEERIEHFREILSGKEYASEYRYLTKNRGYVWGYTRHKPIFEAGRVVEVQGVMVDITDRKEAEESLRKSEEKYRLLFNNTTLMVSVFDYNGICQVANQKTGSILGVGPNELVGKSFPELHPEHGEEYVRRIRQVIDSGKTNYYEDEEDFPGGRRCIFSEVRPAPDAYCIFNQVQVLSADITECRKAERALHTMAEMLDTAPSSITVHDYNGNFLYANQKTFELHGYKREEFMLLNLQDIDVPESTALMKERFSQIEKEGEALFEVVHYRKDGTTFPLEVHAKTIDWHGQPAILSRSKATPGN